MKIMWYPGSGNDFSPISTGIGEPLTRTRLVWMSDYSPSVIREIQNQAKPHRYWTLPCGPQARADTVPRWTEHRREPDERWVEWDIAEFEVPGMLVRFSPFESQAMLNHVFPSVGVELYSLALVRLGGFSCQRPDLDHHGQAFCHLLTQYAERTETQLPEYILSDRDTIDWSNDRPYLLADVVKGWIVHDEPVRVFRRREGFGGCLEPEHNPRNHRP